MFSAFKKWGLKICFVKVYANFLKSDLIKYKGSQTDSQIVEDIPQ
jgi:hypothetical protein